MIWRRLPKRELCLPGRGAIPDPDLQALYQPLVDQYIKWQELLSGAFVQMARDSA